MERRTGRPRGWGRRNKPGREGETAGVRRGESGAKGFHKHMVSE